MMSTASSNQNTRRSIKITLSTYTVYLFNIKLALACEK
uniref:SFRICE_038521 n=1 Tax=Spodoptera frugiperda TaxID=7108 RepID=A0A2H1X3N3_SPOFR